MLSLATSQGPYSWRPARLEDVPAIHQLLLAVDQTDGTVTAGSLRDREREFIDPWSDPQTDSLLALSPEGHVAAIARVYVNPDPEGESRAYLWEEVHPQDRRSNLREFLLTWLEARGRQRLQELPPALPRILRLGCESDQPERIALYEQQGFLPVRHFFRMRRDLRQEIPFQPLPQGLTRSTYQPEFELRLLEAYNESFGDHWAFQATSVEDWQMFFTGSSGFRPDLTYLAMQDDQIAGFSVNYVNPEDNERQGIQEGWIGRLGVRRPWRGRGVASALLCQSMQAFRAEGLEFATLNVDSENTTGALGMYERLGFVAIKRSIAFAKTV